MLKEVIKYFLLQSYCLDLFVLSHTLYDHPEFVCVCRVLVGGMVVLKLILVLSLTPSWISYLHILDQLKFSNLTIQFCHISMWSNFALFLHDQILPCFCSNFTGAFMWSKFAIAFMRNRWQYSQLKVIRNRKHQTPCRHTEPW